MPAGRLILDQTFTGVSASVDPIIDIDCTYYESIWGQFYLQAITAGNWQLQFLDNPGMMSPTGIQRGSSALLTAAALANFAIGKDASGSNNPVAMVLPTLLRIRAVITTGPCTFRTIIYGR